MRCRAVCVICCGGRHSQGSWVPAHLLRLHPNSLASSNALRPLPPCPTHAGVVYAPLLAVRMLVGRAARPALLVGAALGAGRGLRALVGRLRASPARLLSALRALGAEGAALAGVLAQVAGRAARSEGFRKAFIRWVSWEDVEGGVRRGVGEDVIYPASLPRCTPLGDLTLGDLTRPYALPPSIAPSAGWVAWTPCCAC